MLNVKKDKVNRLTGKSDFNVGDLKRILNEIPEATNVRFGVITDKGTSCCQEDNMIFELRSIHEKDQGLVDSDLYIFVDGISGCTCTD